MTGLLEGLAEQIEGEIHFDQLSKTIYATDASVYQEMPMGVVYPKTSADIREIILFARKHHWSLIPRAAGTSLSGQCVGNGLVVDISRYMDQVLNFDMDNQRITVQPGLIRDQLNLWLEPHELFFAPITSTANRATIGGMVGNNSCGANSIVYGDTRQYIVSLKAVLSDGSGVVFEDLDASAFEQKLHLENLEGQLYRQIDDLLKPTAVQESIKRGFPKPSVTRRNTGYALDALLDNEVFTEHVKPFNFSKLIAGSEGTLAFITEVTLQLCPLPPDKQRLVICQFNEMQECMHAVKEIMKFQPHACELMDEIILSCTRDNLKLREARSYFEGDPAAVLLVEFRGETSLVVEKLSKQLVNDLKDKGLGYAFSTVEGETISKIWELRRAGLGLLGNIPGDAKAVACIEDTAVDVEDLADYISDFDHLMKKYGQSVVYYAHAGAGEIHLRPVLNLKTEAGHQKFQEISEDSALLVKKYKGALSGEHGDGRVRAPFIPLVVGEENYQLMESIKRTWDPQNLFNPHKIIDPKPMTTDLRYNVDQKTPEYNTLFDFSETGGMLRMAEKCNGSGDCRKLHHSKGTMCPSYQATRSEHHTTRARANALRNFLTDDTASNPFDREELKEVMDLCLSCKGCTSECPSSVDMATLKAEFQYQYYQTNRIPFRNKVFAHLSRINAIGIKAPRLTNFLLNNRVSSQIMKQMLRVAPQRQLPILSNEPLFNWYKKNYQVGDRFIKQAVYLFCDEFTNYNESELGKKAISLLTQLGYEVKMIHHPESGRAAISKGLLGHAKDCAEKNVILFNELINEDIPLLGIEPSAILGFRDEYPRLVGDHLKEDAKKLAKHTFLVEEFLAKEIRAFRITASDFNQMPKRLMVHGHCHQKSLSKMSDVFTLLSLPTNHTVRMLSTGCCGMAGSFGYEEEHYEVSMKIGELTLFPAVRAREDDEIVVASGTSCRHQIKDGTEVKAYHALEIMYDALKR